MKQGKGRGVVILDRSKYMEKCWSILTASQFAEKDYDPTAYIEGKSQITLRKIKQTAYPTGSSPGKFFGNAKLHKVPNNGTVEQLPLRPVISYIGTVTYDLAKYLSQFLKLLSESQYIL